MTNGIVLGSMDVNGNEWYGVAWCSRDGTNTGASGDTGWLFGETIASQSWSVVDGTCTIVSSSLAAFTGQLGGGAVASYDINTASRVRISGAVTPITAGANGDYLVLKVHVTSSGGREDDATVNIPIEVH